MFDFNYSETVTVFENAQYQGDWPPENFVEAIAWFQAKLLQIPEQYRAAATCEIDSESGYGDSHYGRIVIQYTRPATQAEIDARILARRQQAEADLELARLVMANAQRMLGLPE